MQRNMVETVLGAVVLLVAAAFFAFAYKVADVQAVSGYQISAKFSRIDGLKTGSDVKIGGVKVGSVLGFSLDPQTYEAVVRMSIDPSIRLPADTSAAVVSEGLLDGKSMILEPGADEEMLEDGGMIYVTQSSQNLEQLLGKFIFGLSKENDKKAE